MDTIKKSSNIVGRWTTAADMCWLSFDIEAHDTETDVRTVTPADVGQHGMASD